MTSRRSARKAAPKPDPETYEAGTWAGLTNYGCPFCEFRTLDGAGTVVAHIALRHRSEAIEPAPDAPAAPEET